MSMAIGQARYTQKDIIRSLAYTKHIYNNLYHRM